MVNLGKLTVVAAVMLSASAYAADTVTDLKPAAPADVQKALDIAPDPERVPCQGGEGWLRKLQVEPSEISYRLKGNMLTPGALKPASFERLAEAHSCMGVILHGPQRSSCAKKDGVYQCSAARFITITKDDGSEWSEKDIAKTLNRYTEIQCCVKRKDQEPPLSNPS